MTPASSIQSALDTPFGPLSLFGDEKGLTDILYSAQGSDISLGLYNAFKAELEEWLLGVRRDFSVPWHTQGSLFRERVWKAIRDIPWGEVRTYKDIAREAGGCPQAVGGACGANPLPLITPCHRVVAANGLGGYGGNMNSKTKIWLLEHEGCRAYSSV